MVYETNLYDILTVPVTATVEEITKSYKRLALKYHPDKTNHNPVLTEKFKDVTRAYEILKDPRQREAYDAYGPDGLDGTAAAAQASGRQKWAQAQNANAFGGTFGLQQSMFGLIFEDVNSMFMGGMPFSGSLIHFNVGPMRGEGVTRQVHPAPAERGMNAKKQGSHIHHKFKVSLADMYYGKVTRFQLPKTTMCMVCNGQGCFHPKTCRECKGSGRVIVVTMSQFSKIQELSLCGACHGTGTFCEKSDKCDNCENGYLLEKKILTVNILPGCRDGDKCILRGEADEGKNIIPGDVVIHLEEVPHPFLTRRYNDLYMDCKIDLKTALLGGRIVINDFVRTGEDVVVSINTHGNVRLNDSINASINQGEVVGTINLDEPKLIKGLGMPVNNLIQNGTYFQASAKTMEDSSQFRRGDLYIRFKVELPTIDQFANESDLISLLNVLPGKNVQESFGTVAWEHPLSNIQNGTPHSVASAALSSPMKSDGHTESSLSDLERLELDSHEGEEELEDNEFYAAEWAQEEAHKKKRKHNTGNPVPA